MRKAAISLALGFLAYKGLQYYAVTIEHFAFDYSEANFGRFWPNRFWLLLHIVGGTVALFVGPFQLWSGLRDSHRLIHRWTGRVYVAGVLLGGGTAFYLSFFSQSRSFGVALVALGVAWWFTVSTAVIAIKRHRIEAHKAWMIRGYVVTFSFVTFRMLIDMPLWSFAGQSRLAVVLWLSWVAPLAVAEALLRLGRSEIPTRAYERSRFELDAVEWPKPAAASCDLGVGMVERVKIGQLAELYLAGRVSFADFIRGVPEEPQDEEVAELIDLIEHEPKRGDFLGASPEEHDRHMERIRELARSISRRESAG